MSPDVLRSFSPATCILQRVRYANGPRPAGRGATTGIFYSFLQPLDRKVAMVVSKDFGNEVASLLSSDWAGRRITELGTYISPNELSAAMGEVLGQKVEAQAIPRDHWTATLERFGLPQGKTWAYEEIMDGLNSGWIDFGQPGTESVVGRTPPATVFAGEK